MTDLNYWRDASKINQGGLELSIKVASHKIRFGLSPLHFSTVEYSMKVTDGSW